MRDLVERDLDPQIWRQHWGEMCQLTPGNPANGQNISGTAMFPNWQHVVSNHHSLSSFAASSQDCRTSSPSLRLINSLDSASPLLLLLLLLLLLSISVSPPPFVSVVPSLAHVSSRSASCPPPLSGTSSPLFSPAFSFISIISCALLHLSPLHATFLPFHLVPAKTRPSSHPMARCVAHFFFLKARLPLHPLRPSVFYTRVFHKSNQLSLSLRDGSISDPSRKVLVWKAWGWWTLMAYNFLLLLQKVRSITSSLLLKSSALKTSQFLALLHYICDITICSLFQTRRLAALTRRQVNMAAERRRINT